MRSEGLFSTIYKTLRYPFLPLLQKTAIANNQATIADILKSTAIEDRFTRIYSSNYWGSKESVSGKGSTLNCTKNLRRHLPHLFSQFSIKRVFDAPCGDFNWMRVIVEECDLDYIGADIVEPLVERNNARFKSSKARFIHLDITKDEFPKADLWICRDCLFHLSYDDIRRSLRQFAASEVSYILTTTYKNNAGFENRDIITGDMRLVDLFSKPFNLPTAVLFRIDDYLGRHRREMCLWSRAQIIEGLATSPDHDETQS
jgi:hypothetical protein